MASDHMNLTLKHNINDNSFNPKELNKNHSTCGDYLKDDFSYILITPCKNEEDNLPGLINSVVSQIIKPRVWIIIDDCSDDKSQEIIEHAANHNSWIYNLRLNKRNQYNLDEHYSKICKIGFNYAVKQANRNNLEYKYIALSDADMIYPTDYFYQLISFLKENTEYGIVTGNLLILNSKGESYETVQAVEEFKYPLGTGRVWKKETFEETGGYMITKAPDTVSNIKALLKGWKITQVSHVKYYQTRETGGKEGVWKGYFSKGERDYFLNVNILAIISSVVCTILFERHAFKKSFAYLLGYINSLFKRKNKLKDEEVRSYIGSYKNVLKRYKVYASKLLKYKKVE